MVKRISENRDFCLIPRPKRLEQRAETFSLNDTARIVAETPAAVEIAGLLAEYLAPGLGRMLPVAAGPARDGDIELREDGEEAVDAAGFVREAYVLEVTAKRVRLTGANGASLARGVQTLRQLGDPGFFSGEPVPEARRTLPGVRIEDEPAFRWRGLMLDVVRHFFSVDDVCRMIELAAQHRMNRIHLHLTDDQGWRIEIRRYPRLTEVGSIRPRTLVGHESDRPRRYDETPYGGFFTQDDIRRIVAFAARRRIEVVPEIDLPGHMVAAITAYPWLGNWPDHQLEVRDCWGISYNILRPSPETMEFLRNVFDEVMELFPSRFIHVGGDEARKDEWEINHYAQRRMAELGLRNSGELQSWMIRQLADHLAGRGRRLIGWDEILEGGLPDGATVMSWRGEDGAIAAARLGHDAVNANGRVIYLDKYQADPRREPLAIGGEASTEQVYRYTPVPAALSEAEGRFILGGQGELWAEYIPDRSHLEYMAFPRACALAEKLWRPDADCDYADFLARLHGHRARLAAQRVNAHPLP